MQIYAIVFKRPPTRVDVTHQGMRWDVLLKKSEQMVVDVEHLVKHASYAVPFLESLNQ